MTIPAFREHLPLPPLPGLGHVCVLVGLELWETLLDPLLVAAVGILYKRFKLQCGWEWN